jgi:hypothetical protein
MNLYERMLATQKTVDAFKGKLFVEWGRDCIEMIAAHAKHMGRRLKVPKYSDAKSAAAAMKELGFRTLADAMDANFRRIGAHEILLGDIVEGPGQNGFSTLMVALGNGRVLGFHEEIPHADVLQPTMISGAWRIEPKSKSRKSGVAARNAGLDVVPDPRAVGEPLANLDTRARSKRSKRHQKPRPTKRRPKR